MAGLIVYTKQSTIRDAKLLNVENPIFTLEY